MSTWPCWTDLVHCRALPEAGAIDLGEPATVAPCVVRRRDVGDVLGGEIAARPVYHVNQLPPVDEQGLGGTGAVLTVTKALGQ